MALRELEQEGFQDFTDMPRDEAYTETLRRATYTFKRLLTLGITDPEEFFFYREVIINSLAHPFAIHFVFTTTIEKQGSDTQRAKWLPMIQRFEPVSQIRDEHRRVMLKLFIVTVLPLSQAWPFFAVSPSPFNLHNSMFLATIIKQGTKEQKNRWVPLAKTYAVVGTYAQTELGHGTFLRKLETTATYDVKTKEFIINSPTITSSKFWPGGLGKTANHCVVMARLQIGGQDCGMQSFIVPIRDTETHQPLPGITVGDIGPKFGYSTNDNGFLRLNNVRIPRENMLMRFSQATGLKTVAEGSLQISGQGLLSTVSQTLEAVLGGGGGRGEGITVGDIGPKFGYSTNDNGFLRLNNVRIPRENMLMRFSQVLEDGTFVSPKNDRLVYGSMTLVRSQIVGSCGRSLAKAATIATRYSAVRRQSEIIPGAGEVQVIDFQTQQHKLFPQIATAYALLNAGQAAAHLYTSVSAKIDSGQLEDLPVLHALTAALKAFSSWEMAVGIEQCRMACGGHGYLLASGFPQIYANEVPACTYEGENTVMCLQTARFLNKCQEMANRGETLPPLARFLQSSPGNSKSKLTRNLELDQIIAAYEFRAARATSEANSRLRGQMAQGRNQAQAWNNTSQLLVQAALAFCHAFTVRAFIESIKQAKFDKSLESVMIQLAQLYALSGVLRFSGDFKQSGYMSDAQIEMAQDQVFELLTALKPNAVALVDAFDFPDQVLGSALGRWDGNVYEAIMDTANKSVLNKSQVHPAFYKYQKPFVDSLKAYPKL
ncbi:acyl-CoA oxidase [Plakobranchus ocellatus]|uniref:Acyl-coenzyme A oxidase n=1 Tax=Plakobranchus ocellatus TaxID=259542 RepID=A0AAV4D8E2_9GAST|nr:acyl-CoA oxidase [Plakobranchus ocellatus]